MCELVPELRHYCRYPHQNGDNDYHCKNLEKEFFMAANIGLHGNDYYFKHVVDLKNIEDSWNLAYHTNKLLEKQHPSTRVDVCHKISDQLASLRRESIAAADSLKATQVLGRNNTE